MIIECIAGGIFMENCYILGDEDKMEGILVDPGEQIDQIMRAVDESNLKIKKIVNTHCHLDHVAGVETFKKELDIPFYIHKDDKPVLDVLPEAKSRYPGFDFVELPEVDGYVEEGDKLNIGNIVADIIHVPGHSWGHICIVLDDNIIAGDTVFAGSVGRVDLTGGTSMQELVSNIKNKILTYPENYNIFPGHGPATKVGIEKQSNPFLQGTIFS